jgi:hypothetical protein
MSAWTAYLRPRNNASKQFAVFAAASCVFALALARVHLRVQTTLVGYEIGRLKTDEARLLEERSGLRMQLAKLTTKKHLELMTETGDDVSPETRTYASR